MCPVFEQAHGLYVVHITADRLFAILVKVELVVDKLDGHGEGFEEDVNQGLVRLAVLHAFLDDQVGRQKLFLHLVALELYLRKVGAYYRFLWECTH